MSTTARREESELTRFYALFPQPALARDLFNIVEGHRVDGRIRRAYPGIRRDMGFIRDATAARRPELASLGEPQAFVEALLQHTLGAQPALADLAPATRRAIQAALELIDEMLAEGALVADAARLTARLYEVVDDLVRDPRRWAPQQGEAEGPAEGDRSGQAEADVNPEMQFAPGVENYESMEMPPFMTPVLEELVRQQKEQQGANAPGEGEGEEQDPQGESPDDLGDSKSMQTSQVQTGQRQEGDEAVTSAPGRTDADEAPPGTSPDGRTDDAEGGGSDSPLQEGLAEVPLVQEEEGEEEDLGEHVFYYDEWDHKIEDYRPGWCTLRETAPPAPRRASSPPPSTSSAASSARSGATSS